MCALMFLFMLFTVLGAYLVGAIPSGYWLAKYFFHVDVTKLGSGNIGATNVARVIKNKKLFFLVFFLDAFKSYFWMILSNKIIFSYCDDQVLEWFLVVVAAVLLIGNAYSIFLHFRGGKGVATAVGIMYFFGPLLVAVFIFVWGFVLLIFKRSYIASLVAIAALIPGCFWLKGGLKSPVFAFVAFLVLWIFFRHKKNLEQLW